VKQHTLLDLRGNIPSFIFTSDGKLHDRCAFKLDLARVTKKLPASPALTGRIVFRMDPATSAHQGVLRDERERGQVTSMDRPFGLRARGYRQEAAQPLSESVRNPIDLELDHVRTNPAGSFERAGDRVLVLLSRISRGYGCSEPHD
jgi:hypothetical protein